MRVRWVRISALVALSASSALSARSRQVATHRGGPERAAVVPLPREAPHPTHRQTGNHSIRIDTTQIGLHHRRIVRHIADSAIENAPFAHAPQSVTRTRS